MYQMSQRMLDCYISCLERLFCMLGVENIVHMVTDNVANYVAAGRLLMEEFPLIFWSSCATYCINLILQDIGKL